MSPTSHSDASSGPAGSDLELVRAALRREPEALQRFVDRMRCVPRMLAVRNARAGRPLSDTELEDLSQDIVTAVWRKLDVFDGRARLETWVYQFCYLEFLRRLRSMHSRPRLIEDMPADGVREPTAPIEPAAIEYEHVHESFDMLSAAEGDVLRLKHFEDLTFDEMGERLGLSPNTLKTRYYRALEKLRTRLGQSRVEPYSGGSS